MREAIEEDMPVDLRGTSALWYDLARGFAMMGQCGADLRLYKHQVDEDHHIIVLDVFVRKPLAARALRQTNIAADRVRSLSFSTRGQSPVRNRCSFCRAGRIGQT